MTRVPSFVPGTTTHRPARIASALALATVLLTVALAPPPPASPAQAAARATSTGPAPTPRGTDVAPPCVVTGTRRVEPTMVLLGEAVAVTMTVQATCFGPIYPLHLVLVIEGSAAMAGKLGRDVKEGAAEVVERLNLPNNPATRVAVVGFDDRVRVKCPVSNDPNRVKHCIGRVGDRGNARLESGLAEARRQLRAARRDYRSPDSIREVAVVFAAHPTGGCTRPVREADGLKGDGVLLVTLCIGEDCDAQCLRAVATSPRYHFPWRERMQLANIFDTIRRSFQYILLKWLTITDQLPTALQIVTDTAQPAPNDIDVANGRIGWTQTHIPREGVTVTYRARAVAPDSQPSTLGATATFIDGGNHTGSIGFPSSPITVLGFEPRPPR